MNAATVVIAGAGPTGLTVACDLRSRGIDAQVIDKAAGPATTSRAKRPVPAKAAMYSRSRGIPESGDHERLLKASASAVHPAPSKQISHHVSTRLAKTIGSR